MAAPPESFLQTFQNLVQVLNTGINSVNSNIALALNGYAVGTWTPAINFGGSATVTYAAQNGSYSKIGREIICRFHVVLTGFAGMGAVMISGLPVVANTDLTENGAGGIITRASNMVGLTGIPIIAAVPGTSTAQLLLPTATGESAMSDANFTASSEIDGYFSYFM